MQGHLCQSGHSKIRWTNCFHLTEDPKSLTSIQGTTSWKENEECREDGDFALSGVSPGASKLLSPSRRRGLRTREVLRSSPGLRGFPLPAGSPKSLLDRFSPFRTPAKGKGTQEFRHMSSATTRNGKGSATLAHHKAIIKPEWQALSTLCIYSLMCVCVGGKGVKESLQTPSWSLLKKTRGKDGAGYKGKLYI